MSEEQEPEVKQVLEENEGDLHYQLLTTQDDCEAFLKFLRIDPGCVVEEDLLRQSMEKSGIVYGIDENAFKDLAEKISGGELEASEELHRVAQGKPVVHGDDGHIDYLVDPSPEDVQFDVDHEENIDYKNTNLIQNVIVEQHLATVVQPKDPENGIDLFGNTTQAREGVPIKVKLGPNVVMDGDKIFAQTNGRFISENDELTVNPVYNVRGNVDFTIGNINFIGTVNVQKDILDDFSVYGKEGVEVGGIVGAASVESDADIHLNGGVNGKGKGFVRGAGTVHSKYFNDVTAICREGVEIQKSIMASKVKTKGTINCPNGNIIGGEVTALMGIDVASIGSDLGVATKITAGVDYELEDKIQMFESQLEEIKKEIDRINRIIGPILANKQKLMALPPEKKKALKGLLQQVKSYKSESAKITESLEEVQQTEVDNKAKEIRVRKMLYSGVHVTIGKCKRLIKMEVKGPVRLREDLDGETVSITNLQL